MKKINSNSLLGGTIAGIILPIIIFLIVISLRKGNAEFMQYIKILQGQSVLSKLMSLCLIPNLLLFFIFIWSNKLQEARGVILSMFILGTIILIFRFI